MVRRDLPAALTSSVLNVARLISGYDLDYPKARDLVRAELAGNRGTLLVLDNAPDAFAVEELASGIAGIIVLTTSRHAIDIPRSRHRIHLQPLDAVARLDWCRDLLVGSDASLERLAARVSGFPLLAERLIDMFCAADYSADQGLAVLDGDASLSDARLLLGQSVRRQYDSLRRADEPATRLLLVTALSGSGARPTTALKEVFGEVRAVQLLGSLRLSGLTGANTATALSVHDEVAASLRLLVPDEEKARAGRDLVAELRSQDPLEPSDPSNWRVLGARGELARRLAALPVPDGPAGLLRADVLLSDLSYLRYRGLTAAYHEAARTVAVLVPPERASVAFAHRLRSLNMRDDRDGITAELARPEATDHGAGGNLDARHAVAQAHWKLGDYTAASEAARLPDAPDGSGSHVDTVQLLDLAARIDRERGSYETALDCLENARRIARAHAPHLEVPLAAVEGVLLLDLGRLEYADEVLTYARDRHREDCGAEHPRVALVSNNLGIARQEQGRLEQAWALYGEAKEINLKVYGPGDERVAANLMNMDNVLVDLGGHDAAVALMEESITIRADSAASQRTWAIGIAFHNLAYAHFCAGRHAWAEGLFAKAIALRSRSLPPGDPRVVSSWCGFVRARLRSDRPCWYEQALVSAIAIMERSHADHRVVNGLLWAALAESYFFRDRHPSYRPCAVRADRLLGRWGGRSEDRLWIRRLAR